MQRRISFPVQLALSWIVTAAAWWSSPSSAVAQAPDSFSLNYEKIRFEYSPRDAGPVPFGLDLTLEPDGRLETSLTRIHKVTDVTLKRGIIGGTARGSFAQWEGRIATEVEGRPQIVGDFRVESSVDAGADDEAAVEFEIDPDAGVAEFEYDSLGRLMRVSTPNGAAGVIGVSIQFDAAPGQQLRGSPPDLFNSPRPGEPLIGRLPKPEPGKTIELELKVEDADASKAHTLIPVKIKHNA